MTKTILKRINSSHYCCFDFVAISIVMDEFETKFFMAHEPILD
jgi:hypothetical protein